MDKYLIIAEKNQEHNSLTFYSFPLISPLLSVSLCLSHLFLSAVYDHQVCISPQIVLSALIPGFHLNRDEVQTGFQITPSLLRRLIC